MARIDWHAGVAAREADAASLSIVVPAHNEALRIERTLRDMRAALPEAEIVVVLNDSDDGSCEIVQRLAKEDPLMRVLDVAAHIGKGGAVRIGFSLATREHVAFVDADGATSGAEIRRLLSYLADADCVTASRWSKGAVIGVKQTKLRRLLSRGFNVVVRVLFGLPLTDTQCGAKILRRQILHEVLDEVETADFAFDVDLLYAVRRRGHRILEVPTRWCDRNGSSVNVAAAVPRMLLSLLRLRLRHSFLRILVPLFDRYARTAPIKTRRALRFLVLAPTDGRSPDSSGFERNVRSLFDRIESPARETEWFPLDPFFGRFGKARWLGAMFAYLRRFRDRFDCIVEVLPDDKPLMTPLYSLKPKVVLKRGDGPLPLPYSSALVLHGNAPDRCDLEETLLLALTRSATHIYAGEDGHLILREHSRRRVLRELLTPKFEVSG